jgi:hypothetical protein
VVGQPEPTVAAESVAAAPSADVAPASAVDQPDADAAKLEAEASANDTTAPETTEGT